MDRNVYDAFSPLDYRYVHKELMPYLSENAFTQYKLKVEIALVLVLCRRNVCDDSVLKEVRHACEEVTTGEVYAEEKRIGHDIRALVNVIRAKVSDAAKPFVHMTATSYDIIDTANALRYKDVVNDVLMPALQTLQKTVADIARREAETVQVGRTHGQHAVPVTFGFAMAGFVSRLEGSIASLRELSSRLHGKFSGAVGAYNASSLFFENPVAFEAEILAVLGIRPGDHSTQIVQPEPLIRLFTEIVLACGVMANLARDMRQLQRTEIDEVREAFGAEQVGSSTMPQKRNPINFENIESQWKVVVPRLTTLLLDQVSEHQRDLTNSASSRTYGEIVCYAFEMATRLTRTMGKLMVNRDSLQANLDRQRGLIAAEPLYILLAALGHPDAHETGRRLTLIAQRDGKRLEQVAQEDEGMAPYLARLTQTQRDILADPGKNYTGRAAERALLIANKIR